MRAGRWRRAAGTAAALLFTGGVIGGCGVGPAQPAAAELRTGAPPWDAPRDGVSYIDKAGFERLPLDFSGPAPYTLTIAVTVDGEPVQVPAGIGVDKLRAEQASVHTHTTDGVVWVEAKTADEKPTLAQFFTLWGVRYDADCLADACKNLEVTVNGKPAPWDTPLARNSHIVVTVRP
ncbi:hypothetical protein [Kribbella shirazensis]|uniref:Uncharacterized protein n=1 Tax=Kribbella shirazensis TaxID=1105143 RepID=A0A7X6A0X8_9ACTN|nr:hypothetical protein [Kribbella shirazensis]NIK57677.1 hypothetical protein [Kribbella shirazensis]